MEVISTYIRLASGALFLREEAFVEIRNEVSPFWTGLTLIVLIGLVVSALGLVGTTLEWVTVPAMSEIRDAVWRGLTQMPFFDQMPPRAREQYELGWQVFPALFGAPDPALAALDVLLVPISLVAGWLLFGFLAHFFARLFGGNANLGQTYGVTSLAASPRLIGVVHLVPYVSFWGGLIALWALACNYLALKYGHDLTPGRAFWALLLALITAGVLVIALSAAVFWVGGTYLLGDFTGFMGGN